MKAFLLIVVLAMTCAISRSAPPPATTAPATQLKAARKPKPETIAAEFLDNGPLPKLHIRIDPKELRGLNDRPKEWVRATVREVIAGQPDTIYCDVGVHLKGGPGSFRPTHDKPGLTLNFDKFVEGQDFHGLDKIHLNNSPQDPTYMLENLASWVCREAGAPVTRATNGRVWLNGRDLGIFVIKEGHDDVFFKTYFKDKGGNLYEGSFREAEGDMPVHLGVNLTPPVGPIARDAQKKIDEGNREMTRQAHAKLKELSDACREVDPSKRRERLDKVLDVDRFLTFMACESFLAHWDGYGANRNNYRIYDDPRTGKLVFIAHGMDQVVQRPDYPLVASNTAMVCQAVLTGEGKQRYYERLAEIRKTVFTPERLAAQVEKVSARLAPLVAEYSKDAARQHREMTAQVRQRFLERIPSVDKQLANPPKPLKFDGNNIAELAKLSWEPKLQTGGAATIDRVNESGKERFRVKVEGATGGNGSWRLPLLLGPGRYVFEGQMKLSGVVPGKNGTTSKTAGAGMRLSGDKAPFRMSGDVAWQEVKYEFTVTEQLFEVVLVCDLNGKAGEALFDIASLKLRKK